MIVISDDNSAVLRVCSNCIIVLASDDYSGVGESDPEPLGLIGGDVEHLFPGMVAEHHEDGCDLNDCECENLGSMNSDCDGCGGLPGDRFAVTAVYKS